MSLHALANQMAAKGRNSDSMLVHMAPQEVAGLQALAMKHGGSLTINPDTGLVEANFLKKLLPAIAGFALNAFAPGFGSAIGAALGGLGGAAGTAIGVGGITGLATGSLSKGLMAGMGAYGGASLAGGVMGAGAAELAQAGAPSAANVAGASIPPIEQINPSNFGTNIDKLSSGFGAITKSPAAFGNFAKQNAGALLGVTSPLLADQGVETVTKMDNPGYIRNFEVDLLTQRAKALDPVSVKSLGYPGYADGGAVGVPRTVTQMPGSDSRSSSQAAYEFLMGIAPRTSVAPTDAASTSASGTTNPAAQGRYAWNSDTQSYSFVPAEGIAALAPDSSPKLSYDSGGGDSGSGPGPGDAGASSGTGATAADSADFGDTSSSDSSSSDGAAGDGAAAGDGSAGDGAGGAGAGTGLARGGLMHLHKKFAEGGAARVRDGSSQAAYNYLMGLTNTTRPDAPATMPVTPAQSIYIPPAATTPATSMTTTPVTGGGGGGGGGGVSPITGGASVGNAVSNTDPSPTYSGFVPEPANPNIPVVDITPTPTIQDDGTTAGIQKTIDVAANEDDELGYLTGNRPSPMPEPPPFEPDNSGFYNSEFNTARDIDDATIAVDVPNDGVTAMDNGNTQVDMNPIVQQQPAVQPTVQDTPDGGAIVTTPDTTVVETPTTRSVQPTVVETPVVETPDGGAVVTVPDVEVGNAGGDFGDSGGYDRFIEADSDGNSIDEDDYDYAGNANGGLMGYAMGGMPGYAMGGGLGSLGGYSDGGRLLKGPGDGVSDSIPAMIGKRQPARLADGEFVIPARIVSELGNGSTDAGARRLYQMMDRIQAARKKTVGKGRVAKNSRAEKHLPA